MSLVGPRPLLMEYLSRYTPEQARRHDVLPGMTGWAQVNGRNALTWEQKFAHDVWYVDHWSYGFGRENPCSNTGQDRLAGRNQSAGAGYGRGVQGNGDTQG